MDPKTIEWIVTGVGFVMLCVGTWMPPNLFTRDLRNWRSLAQQPFPAAKMMVIFASMLLLASVAWH